MRRGLIVAAFAVLTVSIAACTALLDLQSARFDGPGDGGPPSDDGSTADGGALDGESSAKCNAQIGEWDGSVGGDTMCPTGIVQLASNPLHCGGCGHSCGGAECKDGQCVPEMIASDGPNTGLLGVNASSVAWTVALDGGAATEVRVARQDGSDARTLGVVDGNWFIGALTTSHVFLPRGTTTSMAYPIDGTAAFVIGGANITAVTVARDEDVFFDIANGTELAKVRIAPGATPTSVWKNELEISDVAVAGPELYWVASTPAAGGGDPRVARVNVETGAKEVSDWGGHASAVAVDGAYAYVFDATTNEVLRIGADLHGGADVLARWTGDPWVFASTIHAATDFLYVHVRTNGPYGAVLRVPRCGGVPLVLQTFPSVGRIAVAGDYVYFARVVDGGVFRVRR